MIVPRRYNHSLYYLIPEAVSGRFAITKGTAKKGSFIQTYHPSGRFYHDELSADYPVVRLVEGASAEYNTIWMSDTPQEHQSYTMPYLLASDHVLMIGLGIGLFPHMLKKHRGVTKITIVEKEQDVVNLVYPYIKYGKTEIIVADGKDFFQTTKDKYDFILIDIWPGIVSPVREFDYWTELAKGAIKPDGKVYCWLQELIMRVKTRLPKYPVSHHGLPAIYEPCLICGKKLRNDYAGLCMDCADSLGVSELYAKASKS